MTARATTIVAVKTRLVERISAAIDDDECQVEYRWPGDGNLKRKRIWLAGSRGDQRVAAMRANRTPRAEDATLDIVIQCERVGKVTIEADVDCLTLGEVVEGVVADHGSWSDLPGVNSLHMSGWNLDSIDNDKGTLSELIYTVTIRSRLT